MAEPLDPLDLIDIDALLSVEERQIRRARIGAAVDGERGCATECGNHRQDLPETFE